MIKNLAQFHKKFNDQFYLKKPSSLLKSLSNLILPIFSKAENYFESLSLNFSFVLVNICMWFTKSRVDKNAYHTIFIYETHACHLLSYNFIEQK